MLTGDYASGSGALGVLTHQNGFYNFCVHGLSQLIAAVSPKKGISLETAVRRKKRIAYNEPWPLGGWSGFGPCRVYSRQRVHQRQIWPAEGSRPGAVLAKEDRRRRVRAQAPERSR